MDSAPTPWPQASSMAIDPRSAAALAVHRFGFGPRLGTIAAIAGDPRGALLAELDRPSAGTITDPALPDSGGAARAFFSFAQEQRAARRAAGEQPPSANSAQAVAAAAGNNNIAMSPVRDEAGGPGMDTPRPQQPGVPQRLYLADARGRIDAALGADIGFVERLVWFWSNHFCVSADKGAPVRSLAGAFEREAIRSHVLGQFRDMLLAVESHPAMLFYLDNVRSMGPNSIAGQRQHRGLNENLARETLELHTLGVRTGYTQTDVTNFAKVITGWSVVPFKLDPEHGGEFMFNPRLHEPGPQTVMGTTYTDGGFEQGRAVLDDLAKSPATAKHLAAKLATHFVADVPPSPFVDRLARRFSETDGNLKEVAKALVTSPEAWDAPRTKLKRPGEWIVASLRAVGVTPPDIRPVVQAQNLLGEPLWRPPAPKGFSDDSAAWTDGLADRLDIANQLSRRVVALVDPVAVVDTALGPLASPETRQTVARAESRQQALALLLMSPEFQRR
jgi:uncharacterized protein (DUF1800 family)